MKLTLSFLSSRFAKWTDIQDKKLNILRTKRAFELKQKTSFIIFKGLLAGKNYLRPESMPCSLNSVIRSVIKYDYLTF